MPDDPVIETLPSTDASVKIWLDRINEAKAYWESDFKRMRNDMEFAAGYQWRGQTTLQSEQYVADLTLRAVNQKVSVLYARNPKAVVNRRERMVYQVWDEKQESLVDCYVRVMTNPLDLEAQATLSDYIQGQKFNALLDRIARTLRIVYQHQVDQQEPEFKLQMKQLVRRVVTAGVGYVRVNFLREFESFISSSSLNVATVDRAKLASRLAQKLQDGDLDPDSEHVEDLKNLLSSLQAALEDDQRVGEMIEEKLVFDFPRPTSVIIDPACTAIKGFVNADWITQEYFLEHDKAEAYFEVKLPVSDGVKTFGRAGNELPSTGEAALKERPRVCVWEVFDKTTKCSFFLCKGFKRFLLEPKPVYPCLHRFWPIFSLTFNDIEVEEKSDDQRASPFPPSDVTLMRHPQKEWNRSRDSLRSHRIANRPMYATKKQALSEEDKENLQSAAGNSVIELQGAATEGVNDLLQPITKVPVDPALYDTDPLMQDILMSSGMQSENLGPTQPNATATGASIAEQSRLTSVGSNVDDLDDLLSDLAKSSGELLMQEMSEATVKRIAGPGAAWPQVTLADFINEVYLQVEAASSGKPNQALAIANLERVMPLIMAAISNPLMWPLIREAIKRLDDRLDVNEILPAQPPAGMMAPAAQPQTPPRKGSQKSPTNPSNRQPAQVMPPGAGPVPLVGQA